MLCENPKTKVAARKSRKSRGKSQIFFLICPKMTVPACQNYFLFCCWIKQKTATDKPAAVFSVLRAMHVAMTGSSPNEYDLDNIELFHKPRGRLTA